MEVLLSQWMPLLITKVPLFLRWKETRGSFIIHRWLGELWDLPELFNKSRERTIGSVLINGGKMGKKWFPLLALCPYQLIQDNDWGLVSSVGEAEHTKVNWNQSFFFFFFLWVLLNPQTVWLWYYNILALLFTLVVLVCVCVQCCFSPVWL